VTQRFHDVLVRTESDRFIVRECRRNYRHFAFDPLSRVLDLGANIGGFAVMCAKAGVVSYHGFEPEQDNFNLLTENVSWCRAKVPSGSWAIERAAVVTTNDTSVDFYIKQGKTAAAIGRTVAPKRITRQYRKETVPAVHVDDVFERVRPTHVKMDIERGEIAIMDHWQGYVPRCVDEIFLELHGHDYCLEFYETHHRTMLADGFYLIHSSLKRRFWQGVEWEAWGEKGVMPRPPTILGAELFYKR